MKVVKNNSLNDLNESSLYYGCFTVLTFTFARAHLSRMYLVWWEIDLGSSFKRFTNNIQLFFFIFRAA